MAAINNGLNARARSGAFTRVRPRVHHHVIVNPAKERVAITKLLMNMAGVKNSVYSRNRETHSSITLRSIKFFDMHYDASNLSSFPEGVNAFLLRFRVPTRA